MVAHCPVARPVALVCGSVPEAVAPLFHHVEALGVPDVRLQPHVLPLAAVELQQQISVPAAGLAAPALCLFLLLLGAGLEALLSLEEGGHRNVTVLGEGRPAYGTPDVERQWDVKVRRRNIQSFTILLATSLSLQGSRLVVWLMARLLMCLGRAPNTWQLPVVLVTAFSMALTSAALTLAKGPAEYGWEQGRRVEALNVMHQ